MKSDFKSESLKKKILHNYFFHNLMIGCCKKNRENCLKKVNEQRRKFLKKLWCYFGERVKQGKLQKGF